MGFYKKRLGVVSCLFRVNWLINFFYLHTLWDTNQFSILYILFYILYSLYSILYFLIAHNRSLNTEH